MDFFFSLLTVVGAAVVALFGWAIISEAVRTCRQASRIAAVHSRIVGRRKVSVREWVLIARREFLRGYSTLRIGVWEIPHDPSKPIRRAFYW